MLRRVILLIGGAAIVVASFLGTTWLIDTYWGPSCPQGQSFLLKRSFNGWGGFSYTAAAAVPGPPDDSDAPTRSKYVLCEDDTLLGPAHSDHGSIAKVGGGRFSHWTSGVIFSTSDNTNPNTNGRAYRLVE